MCLNSKGSKELEGDITMYFLFQKMPKADKVSTAGEAHSLIFFSERTLLKSLKDIYEVKLFMKNSLSTDLFPVHSETAINYVTNRTKKRKRCTFKLHITGYIHTNMLLFNNALLLMHFQRRSPNVPFSRNCIGQKLI